MPYSKLNEIPRKRDTLDVFRGYNHNLRIGDGEFYDMKNLTSSSFPILKNRDKRGIFNLPHLLEDRFPTALMVKDRLYYIDNEGSLTIDYGYGHIKGVYLGEKENRYLISMGSYIIVMPDKFYINALDIDGDDGRIEQHFKSTEIVEFSPCKIDGGEYEKGMNIQKEPPPADNLENGYLWVDISSKPHVLKQFNASSKEWVTIATTYVKIQSYGIAENFKQYDGVLIDGISSKYGFMSSDLNGKYSVIQEAYHDPDHPENDYLVVIGMCDHSDEQYTPITVDRKMPEMDFVIEANNRLWGCRYGKNEKGEIVNEIYASKLGDFKNWNCFQGISTDSYVASCGTDGAWTGAVSHLGNPVFFKEDCMNKIYGTMPSNFQIQSTPCKGVQKGCGNSIAIVNGTMFYKSRNGVCAYDGSLPVEISQQFGDIHYTGIDETMSDKLRNGAVAGAVNNKYYISMKSEQDDKWHMFVYDSSKGLWHREDNTRVDRFCSFGGELYYIDHETKEVKTVNGSGAMEQGPVEWYAVTGIMGIDKTKQKYISNIHTRMMLDIDATVRFEIEYDSSGIWESVAFMRGTSLRSFTIPIRPRRCDHFRLKISGKGDCTIYTMVKTFEQGSDVG